MRGVSNKDNHMIDTEQSKSLKLIFSWRGSGPFKAHGDRKKAKRIVSLFACTFVSCGIGSARLSDICGGFQRYLFVIQCLINDV